MNSETATVYEEIKKLLASHGVEFREVHHEPTRTSAESAKARGEDLAIGGKAILMKVGEEFKLFVLSAAKKVDSQKIKEHFGEKKLRFATPEELMDLTGLVPGAVPPFGKPVTPFDLYVDVSITANEKIAFNAGSLTDSIIMGCKDYLQVASPEVFEFAA
ncbi:MAG: YbaK/EbsC family protein [Bacteroidota bacterium]